MGVLGLLVPEAHGGLGLDELDLVLLLEETGRAALPEPLVETAAVGGAAARASSARRALASAGCRAIAGGRGDRRGRPPGEPVRRRRRTSPTLLLLAHDGRAPRGRRAATSRCDAPARRSIARGGSSASRWTPTRGDARRARRAARARCSRAALDRGALACRGAARSASRERMLDLTVEYAKQREQFGAPIGSFQAVKHHLADVQVQLEFARPLVYRAAHSVGAADARDARGRRLDAKVAAGGGRGARRAHRAPVHGAIGYTSEYDLHLWMKRAWALARRLGRAPLPPRPRRSARARGRRAASARDHLSNREES